MMSDSIQQPVVFHKPATESLPDLLAESIRQAIQEGRLKPGEQLPSEPQFADQLGVSRTTLRSAVKTLLMDGILEQKRGVGTFVAKNPLIIDYNGSRALPSITELIRLQGYAPGTVAFKWEVIPASEDLARELDLSPGTELIHLSRTRTANGKPVIHCEEYLPTTVLRPEMIPQQTEDWSLYRVLRNLGRGARVVVCTAIPVVADPLLAERLQVPIQHSLLLLRQTHYSSDGKPVLFCETYNNSSEISVTFTLVDQRPVSLQLTKPTE